MRILIVEDDIEQSSQLKRLLVHKLPGIEVDLATSLTGGKERFEEYHHTVVVLDADLSDSGAFETLRQIPFFEGAEVIVNSGIKEDSILTTALQCGATDFILKASDEDIVKRIFIAYLRRHYATRNPTS